MDRYERLGTPLFVDRVRAAIDRLGSSPARTPPKSRSAVLRRHDNGWETGFVGNTFTIADARGLRHLASLVGSPDREIAAIDLVEPLSRGLVAGEARHALLDDDAKTAYRRRIRLLQDQLDEADRHGDVERNAHVQAELDFLLDELRRAVGLGGRDRVESTANERARMAVRKAIVATIDRLARHDPLFADHLRRNVRTGHLCAYVGDPNAPVEWLLS